MRTSHKSNFFIAIISLICFVQCSENTVVPEDTKINLNTFWEKSKGMDNLGVKKILNFNGKLIAATRDSGVYISLNNGIGWNQKNNGIKGVPVDWNSNNLFSITDISTSGNYLYTLVKNDNIYLSTNNEILWEPTNFDKEKLFVGAANLGSINGNSICVSAGSGRFVYARSKDNGKSWNVSPSQDFYKSIYNYKSSQKDLYGSTIGSGLIKSVDQGITWNSIWSSKISKDVYQGNYFVTSNIVSVGTSEGIYISKDHGNNWKTANSVGLGADKSKISHFVVENDWVFAVSTNSNIFISKIVENDFLDWKIIKTTGLPEFNSYIFLSTIIYSNGNLIIGITDLNGIGQIAATKGHGTYYTKFSLEGKTLN